MEIAVNFQTGLLPFGEPIECYTSYVSSLAP